MPIVSEPYALMNSDVYFDLRRFFGRHLYLKCEGFNFAGSLKLRSAAAMVAAAERAGELPRGARIIESSSGNLGIALSVIAADKGLGFTCVTDPRCNPATVGIMRALGAEVIVVEPQPHVNLLEARLDLVRSLCAKDPSFVWLNQYANAANWAAHYDVTGPGIVEQFPDVDVVFCGTGTTGTAMGCARYFRDNGLGVRVVAVDAIGSIIFGGETGRRMIPGLGSSIQPPLLDMSLIDDVVLVSEIDTIRMCRTLTQRGLLMGGSTGTVVSGALRWLAEHDPFRRLTSIAISPDLGERYVDTVYNDEWVAQHFGMAALAPIPVPAEQTYDAIGVEEYR